MRRISFIVRLFLFAALGAAATLPLSAQPFPITVLVLEGDTVTGVGLVVRIDNLAVNDGGGWLVEADTDNADTNADSVLLRGGALYLREGDPLALPAGASLDTFDSVNLNSSGHSGWNFFLTGPPIGFDSGIYFDTTLVIQEGDISTAPEFGAGTKYLGYFDAKLNDSGEIFTVASVDDPTIAGTLERALVMITVDGSGALVAESALAKEGDILQGQTQALVELGTGPHQSAVGREGRVLFFADLDGDTTKDGVIYLSKSLIAQEGYPSPVTGRSYELLSSRGLDVNNFGQVVFKANLDGDTASDEMIVREGAELIREGGTLPAISPFLFTAFGTGTGPVEIDDLGNVLWFGDWDDPNADVDTGLFLNNTLLVQEGVTTIHGVVVDIISSGEDAFSLSSNGRYVMFEATLLGGTEGAFLIEVKGSPPVPDGSAVPGAQMTVGKNANGTDLDVVWDAVSCPGDEYNLFYGDLASVSAYAYTGAACGLGTTGQATFTPPAGNLFFIIAAESSSGLEGGHGFDGTGRAREASAGGLCGVTGQIRSAICQ